MASFATQAQAQPAKTFKQAFAEGLDSIAKARGFDPSSVNILADTAVRQYIDERISPNPKAILYVQHSEYRSGGARVIAGTIIPLLPPKSSENFSFLAYFGPQIIEGKEQPEEGFWESVLQPTLVTLGAVAIIALFFLIRS